MTIEELEVFFASYELPKEIQLHKRGIISDIPLFVESHIRTYKNNLQSRVFDIFRIRLIRLRELLEAEKRPDSK